MIGTKFIPAEARVSQTSDGHLLVQNALKLNPYPANLGVWLRGHAAARPDKTFLKQRRDDGEWEAITYREMLRRVNQVSSGLLALDLPAAAPIAVLSPNTIEMAIVQLAAMQIGHPVAPISNAYSVRSQTGELINHILKVTVAPVVVMSDANVHWPKLERWDNAGRLLYAFQNGPAHAGVRDFSELAAGDGTLTGAGEARFEAVTAGTLAKIQFTSGSTNLPKGVEVTHGMLTSNQVAIAQLWPFLSADDVMVDWLPWNHTFGGNFVFNMALMHGMTLAIDDGNPTPAGLERTIKNIVDVRPTIYFGVPASYAALFARMQQDVDLRRALLERLKFFFVAAAALDQTTFEGLRDMARKERGKDIPFFSAWGTTETAPCATLVYWVADDIRVIGLPMPGTTLKLVDLGEPNRYEVRITGPHISAGYYNNPTATREAFDQEGFYRTGDAAAFLNPENPSAGIVFSGRLGEDFKLASGVWVRNAAIRGNINRIGKPYLLEVILAAPDRPYLNALVVPNMAALRTKFGEISETNLDEAEFLSSEPVVALFRRIFQEHNREETGSSRRIFKFAILATPLAFDRGETTDKGYVNQAAVLKSNIALVERSYEEGTQPGIWLV